MIPFSLLQIRLIGPDGEASEVRALELSPGGFTFRLPLSDETWAVQVQRVNCRFVHVRSGESCSLTLTDFDICMEKKEPYYLLFRLTTKSEDFRKEALRLSQEYLDYIEAKLYLEDAALSKKYYPEYPEDEEMHLGLPDFGHVTSRAEEPDYAGDYDSSVAGSYEFASAGDYDSLSAGNSDSCSGNTPDQKIASGNPVCSDLGIVLRTPADRTRYLQSEPESFLSEYLSRNHIPDTLLEDNMLRYIYVGDSFCPLLFPSLEECKMLTARAMADGLSLVFLLAPVPESLLEQMCRAIAELAAWLANEQMQAEIEVGDIGLLQYCKKYEPVLKAYPGILMHKKVKDPRRHYMNGPGDGDVLSCLDTTAHAIYLPYYQTNTATFCTLQAVLRQGNRGILKRITRCDMDCERAFFLYPEHLKMIGRGNSLFGFCEEALEDIKWRKTTKHKRIVLNY